MTKLKIIGLILTLMMLIATLGALCLTAFAEEVTTDVTVTVDTGASVTLKDTDGDGYHEIGSADELYAYAAAVNGGNETIKGELTKNIVVNPGSFDENGNYVASNEETVREWIPIGAYDPDPFDSPRFYSEFNGNGFTVSGLYYNNANREYIGFFGVAEANTVIKNVGVVNSYFNAKMQVGGIAASSDGLIQNCYFDGVINGKSSVGGIAGNIGTPASVINCYNLGTINATEDTVGGIVGSSSGNMENCYNRGEISSLDNFYIGALIGYDDGQGEVKNCFYLTGTSAGGICTKDAEGVTEPKTDAQFASGEVAYLLNGSASSSSSSWRQTIGKDSYPVLSGNVVYSITCVGNTAYSNENKNRDAHDWNKGVCLVCSAHCEAHDWNDDNLCQICGVTCGVDFPHEWEMIGKCEVCGQKCDHDWKEATCQKPKNCSICLVTDGGTADHDYGNDGVCVYCKKYEPCHGEGTAQSPYEIDNRGNLFWFAEQVNQGDTDACALLTADIVINSDLLTEANALKEGEHISWIPIGSTTSNYVGTFDGNRKSITGLYYNDQNLSSIGFFSFIGHGGTVKNLSLINAYISARQHVGIISGSNYGIIENCYVSGVIYVPLQIAGGITGGNLYSGQIIGCKNAADVIVPGVDAIADWAGGIAGVNYGQIDRCINEGNITSDTVAGGIVGILRGISVTNCLNLGTVTGSNTLGGIVGFNNKQGNVVYNGFIENCLNLGKVIGTSSLDSICAAFEDPQAMRNCYFLSNGENTNETALPISAEQLALGEVAYLLGTAWGMDLSSNSPYPMPNGLTVYRNQLSGCSEESFVYEYSNEQKDPIVTHKDEDQDHICDGGCNTRLENCSPDPDDGDCTTDIKCSVCKKVVTKGADAHTGGNATCVSKAKCEACGKEYGEILTHSHSEEFKFDSENHWNECVCSDKANVAPHADSNEDNDENCDTCGYAMAKEPADETDKPTDKTDDSANATDKPADVTDTPADVTDTPADETNKPADETNKPADVTDTPADVTDKPANETDKPVDATENKTTDKKVDAPANDSSSGCNSSVTLSALAIVATFGSGIVIKKKD